MAKPDRTIKIPGVSPWWLPRALSCSCLSVYRCHSALKIFSDPQNFLVKTRQGRPRHPANASQTNKKIYSPVHRFCDPITTTFGDFTGFQWRNCRSFSWGHNNSWPVNYRSDPGRFSGIKTWDFEAQAGKSRTARLSGARNGTLW